VPIFGVTTAQAGGRNPGTCQPLLPHDRGRDVPEWAERAGGIGGNDDIDAGQHDEAGSRHPTAIDTAHMTDAVVRLPATSERKPNRRSTRNSLR